MRKFWSVPEGKFAGAPWHANGGQGTNLDGVTLVGVLDADLSLYVDSYRASETTFNMLTQVVGRAGRGKRPGRARFRS